MAKHHRLMFGLLLAIIVVSFVFYTGSGSIMNLFGHGKSPEICGVKIYSSDANVYRYGVALQSGGEVSAQQLAQRIVLVNLAEKFQIPNPSQEEFDAFLKRNFTDSAGTFRPETIPLVMKRFGMDEETFKDVFVHSMKIEKLIEILAGTPTMTDAEAALVCRELQTEWTIQTARFAFESFKFDGEPSDEELQKFFVLNANNYKIAPLVKLSYALVPASAETKNAVPEPQESELKMFIRASLGNAANVENEISNNREKWINAWKEDRISVETASKVSDILADVLPQDLVNPEQQNFEETLKKSGLEFVEIPAFPRNEAPKNSAVPEEILSDAANSLNSTLWRTDAIPLGENALVILFRGNDPARIPELSEIREIVVADWKKSVREEKFLARAEELGNELRSEVASGEEFIRAANALGLAVVPVPAFSAQNVPENLQGTSILDALKSVPEKSVTETILVGNDAIFAIALKKSVTAVVEKSEDFKALAKYLGSRRGIVTLNVQLSEIISEELEKSRVKISNSDDED